MRHGDFDLDEGDFPDCPRPFDERKVRLLDFGRREVAPFLYLYDFGNCWRHTVGIELLLALDTTPRVAACIAGASRVPRSVAGFHGSERFLALMANRNDPDHADLKRWCGGHFDPDWFDLARTEKDVKKALGGLRRSRLFHDQRYGNWSLALFCRLGILGAILGAIADASDVSWHCGGYVLPLGRSPVAPAARYWLFC